MGERETRRWKETGEKYGAVEEKEKREKKRQIQTKRDRQTDKERDRQREKDRQRERDVERVGEERKKRTSARVSVLILHFRSSVLLNLLLLNYQRKANSAKGDIPAEGGGASSRHTLPHR